jgi:hypothetical protein
MRGDDPNLDALVVIADSLGRLREEIVFVGGSVAGLLISDSLAEGVRATVDVDAIVEAATLHQYHQVEKQLPNLGFTRDISSDVICRWKHKTTGVLFDLMPTHSDVLGFSNLWYPEAVSTAVRTQLKGNIEVRVISAACFIATKLEAFISRGRSDIASSHDLEDILNIVDGRPALGDELKTTSEALQNYVREQLRTLLSNPSFENYLPGLLADEKRAPIVISRLRIMTA